MGNGNSTARPTPEIFSVVQIENLRQDFLVCAENAKALSSAENEIKCDDRHEITIKRADAEANPILAYNVRMYFRRIL